MRRRRLALQSTAPLSTALPKFPLKKEAQIAQIKITAFTVPSVLGLICIFFFSYPRMMCFPSVMEATLVFTTILEI